MDVRSFTSELLRALAKVEAIERVALRSEGPVAHGWAYVTAEMFLAFYYNEKTGTIAFALVNGHDRIWGIDRDEIRGWHFHPLDNPTEHIGIEPLAISEIVARLKIVLENRASIKSRIE